jgi:hypothetical protein
MESVITVPNLTLHIQTGEAEKDPYGQGFAAIYAEVQIGERLARDALTRAYNEQATVTVRCAMLDVLGRVTKSTRRGSRGGFVVAVEDLTYRKPDFTASLVNRRLRKG